MTHQLYINEVLFGTYEKLADAFAAFTDWEGRGFNVRLAFNQTQSIAA